MIIPPITTNSPTFGIYINTKPTWYGYVNHGIYKGQSIDVYNAFENGKIRHKLFYVTDAANNWIKSKLKFYHNGEYIGQARSENVGKNIDVSR
jgi:hypothetical protein